MKKRSHPFIFMREDPSDDLDVLENSGRADFRALSVQS